MVRGFFRIAYTGAAGSGLGIVLFHAGTIVGADVAGGILDGSYTERPDDNQIVFQLTLTLPAGSTPVQTGVALAAPYSMPIEGSISDAGIESGEPKRLETPLGPVNVLFLKIRDI